MSSRGKPLKCDSDYRECDPIEPLIRIVGGEEREERCDASYYWDGERRGSVGFVVIQRTISGSGYYEDENGLREVPKGCAFISVVPERSRYFYHSPGGEPWVFSWVNFFGGLATGLWRSLQKTFGAVIPMPDRSPATLAFHQLNARAQQGGFRDPVEASEAAYRFYLETWRQMMEGSPDPAVRLELVLRHCKERLREGITIKEVAAAAKMSREHFSREFRRAFGVPPATYLREQRLIEAEMLLRHTLLPIHEIAGRTGFTTTRNFREAFQRRNGVPPQAFRDRSSGADKRNRLRPLFSPRESPDHAAGNQRSDRNAPPED